MARASRCPFWKDGGCQVLRVLDKVGVLGEELGKARSAKELQVVEGRAEGERLWRLTPPEVRQMFNARVRGALHRAYRSGELRRPLLHLTHEELAVVTGIGNVALESIDGVLKLWRER